MGDPKGKSSTDKDQTCLESVIIVLGGRLNYIKNLFSCGSSINESEEINNDLNVVNQTNDTIEYGNSTDNIFEIESKN